MSFFHDLFHELFCRDNTWFCVTTYVCRHTCAYMHTQACLGALHVFDDIHLLPATFVCIHELMHACMHIHQGIHVCRHDNV
jgi:hypothetical protein